MKIAICIPVYADTKALFTRSLAEMLTHSLKERPGLEITTLMRSSSLLAWARCQLAEDAARADYQLWLDADHYFPPRTLLALLAHDRDVVVCNYPRRRGRPSPVAWALGTGTPVTTTTEKARNGLEEVGGSGLGVCLIRSNVMATLPPPPFDLVRDVNGKALGEDNYFFRKVRQAGFKIWLDHALSWDVGHVAETVLTNAQTAGRENVTGSVLPRAGPG